MGQLTKWKANRQLLQTIKQVPIFIQLVFGLLLCFVGLEGRTQSDSPKVVVLEIKSEIDPRMLRYIELGFDHVEDVDADYVVIDMDSFGGVLTDSKEIVDIIMKSEIPVWVFINTDAASAGALISIACDSIYMAPGSSIGAATVVDGSGAKAPDKYQSYMRSIMRSTAEERGRDPKIAEGMVDESIEIDSVTQDGKVITLTTEEALRLGYCEAKVNSIEELLELNGVKDYDIETFTLSSTEKIIAFFLNPFISGLLIMVIIGGIYFELQTPGVGFPITAALIALVLYLVPYYLNGMADNWEIIMLFVGLLLIAAEVLVIPGFGVAGIGGITLTVAALILIMVDNNFFNFDFVPAGQLLKSSFAVLGALSAAVLLLIIGGPKLAQSHALKSVINSGVQESNKGFSVKLEDNTLVGKRGITHTELRPGGKIVIEDNLYDAFSRGEYIGDHLPVEVIGTESARLIVKQIHEL